MFFPDPALAFANLRKAAKRGGRLVFACWRELARNPWHTVPLEAARQHVPPPPEPGPDCPPVLLADEARLRRILAAAGFARVAPTPVALELDLARERLDAAVETRSTSASRRARSKASPRRRAPPGARRRSAPRSRPTGAAERAPQSGHLDRRSGQSVTMSSSLAGRSREREEPRPGDEASDGAAHGFTTPAA